MYFCVVFILDRTSDIRLKVLSEIEKDMKL